MAASGSLARAVSTEVSADITYPVTQKSGDLEVGSICASAGACFIGIQRGFGIAPDLVLFQPRTSTLAIPLVEFANPERAVVLIHAKLAQSGRISRDFIEAVIIATLGFAIGFASAAAICLGGIR